MYIRGNLGQEQPSLVPPGYELPIEIVQPVDPGAVAAKLARGEALTQTEWNVWEGLSPGGRAAFTSAAAVTVTPSQQVSVPTAPVTGDLLEREIVAGTGIKVKHAVLAGGGIFLVAALGKKKR